MPGVYNGDLGPKFGYHSKCNGWMTLTNVRVPRNQLLQKYVKVDRNGEVSLAGDMRVLYASMLSTRFHIVAGTRVDLQKALLIGIRYSIVRR